MSKRDYRKKLLAKAVHKAELKAKVVAQYSRVSEVDLELKKERDARGNLFADLRDIFFGNASWTWAIRSMIKRPPSALDLMQARRDGYPKPSDEIITHPLIAYATTQVDACAFTNQDRRAILNLVDISKRSKFFDPYGYKENPENNRYLTGLINLGQARFYWKKMPDLWHPQDESAERQFSSLVQFILAQYPMPKFFDKVWQYNDKAHKQQQEWYLNVANGANIRTQKGLPIVVSKKIAHYMMQAPEKYSFNQALRYGQIMSLGGNIRVAGGVLSTPLGENFDHDDFWVTVIKFFITNPLLDTSHYRSIYDYIYNQKYHDGGYIVENGIQRHLLPPQPNFCMKNREPNTLLLLVDRWHRALAERTLATPIQSAQNWPSCGIKAYKEKDGGDTYAVRELLSADELWQDGKEMRQCVGSYSSSCARGAIAIFSMSVFNEEKGVSERLLTMEVSLETHEKSIIQARGRFNAQPSPEAYRVMKNWARVNDLRVDVSK